MTNRYRRLIRRLDAVLSLLRRLGLCALLLVALSATASAQQFTEREDVRACVKRLWEFSMGGLVPGESATVVTLNLDTDGMECKKLLQVPTANTIRVKVNLADHPVVVMHTHPLHVDPRPSDGDGDAAKGWGIPVYVLSRGGVWVVDPDKHATKIAETVDALLMK